MPLALNKRLLWMIVIWFAVLQTISPFIHAHIEADSSTQSHGLHLHVPNLMQVQDAEHTLKNASTAIHTIGINKAFVRNVELLPLPLFAVLFVIGLFVITIRMIKVNLITRPLYSLHLCSQSRARAPPLF